MRKITQKLFLFLLMCLTIFLLASCNQVTQQNFDKIQPGMSIEQVRTILGEPTNMESVNIAGISGAVATWKHKDASITIHFLNNTVTIKTFYKDANEPIVNGDMEMNQSNGNNNTQ